MSVAAPYVPSEFEQYVGTMHPMSNVRRLGADLMTPSAVPAAAGLPEPSPLVPDDYVVVPGDTLRVSAWGSVDADLLLVVDGAPGGAASGIADGARAAGLAPDRVLDAPDAGAAVALLMPRLAPGDVVLVKASRGLELERAVDGLVAALGGRDGAA